jgi:hypothetical protein
VRRLTIALDEGGTLDGVLRTLIGAGAVVHLCDHQEPDLEQAFSRILEAESEEA